ncbi:hypothetical protein ABG751_10175 [Streptococcus iniae]
MSVALRILFYIIIFTTHLAIFFFIRGKTGKWWQMVLFILLSSSISNILDTYALVIDPLYLLVFSYVIDKSLPLAYHVFYSFYTTIIVELSFRIVAYTVLSYHFTCLY